MKLSMLTRRLPDGPTQWKFSQGKRNAKPRIYSARHAAEREGKVMSGVRQQEPLPQNMHIIEVEIGGPS